MYLKLIACEIMVREVCHVIATSPHICDVAFLDQGYHDRVNEGRDAIQAHLDAIEPERYDAVLVGYGLCNNLIAGLRASHTPLIVPRGHDCITFFLGSKERYQDEFGATPGTYWYSSGWIECRARRGGELMDQTGAAKSQMYEEYVRKFGEDNANYLMEALGEWKQHYERGALIRFDFDAALTLDRHVRDLCDERGWRYEELNGDLGLLRRWVHGDWNDDEFLTVPPGQSIRPSWDGGVIGAE